MSISMTLYKFSKKHNSTALPTGGAVVSGTLKERCSREHPTVTISSASFPDYNMASIPAFGRVYWIDDITFTADGFWELSMHVDALASWRAAILASTQYVTRSASDYTDTLIDAIYPTEVYPTSQYASLNDTIWDSGGYVLGVIGKNTSGSGQIGAVTYYAVSSADIANLYSYLLGSSGYMGIDWTTVTTFTDSLMKAFVEPAKYIVSCMWFPYAPTAGASKYIDAGWWTTNQSAHVLATATTLLSRHFVVPKHPQIGTENAWLCSAPYSSYILYFPPFGTFPIDSAALSATSTLSVQVRIDYVSGMATLRAFDATTGQNFVFAKTQIGVPMQMSQITNNMIGSAVSGIIGGAGAAAMAEANPVGAVASLLGGVQDAASKAMPQIYTVGGNGSRVDYLTEPRLQADFYAVTDFSNARLGRPLYTEKVLSTLSGYCECANVALESAGMTDAENSAIINLMEGGFYIE